MEFMRSIIIGMNVCFLHMYGPVIRRNYICLLYTSDVDEDEEEDYESEIDDSYDDIEE